MIHNFFYVCFFFLNFIYFWLRWASVAARGLFSSCCCLRCGAQASHCGGPSRSGARALGTWASAAVAHGLSCSTACGILPDQGLNPCPLHWQADSQPLRHQGSPRFTIFKGYTPFIVIIKYWLYSLCCTIYPCSLFYT